MNRTALLIGLLLPAGAVGAQDPPASSTPKIAVLNLPQVFDGYRMTKDLEQRFDNKRLAIREEAENRRQSMDNQRAALEAFDPASKDYTERREELLRQQIEFQVWLEFEEQRLKAEHMAWLLQIYRNVNQVVEATANRRGIDLVLTYDEISTDVADSFALRQQFLLKKVLYFSNRLDLTEQVLKELNEQYATKGGGASLGSAPPLPVPQQQRPTAGPGAAP